MQDLSDKAIEARRKYLREYMRNYRKQHPDKYAEYNRRYWEKKAKQAAAGISEETK